MGVLTAYCINPTFLRPLALIVLAIGIFDACKNETMPDQSGHLWSQSDRGYLIDELDRTSAELMGEINNATEEQWNFVPSLESWNIGEVVEHLTVQNELHFREIRAISVSPPSDEWLEWTTGSDDYFKAYATDTTRGTAQWFLEPIGRFCQKANGIEAFVRARSHLRGMVEETEVDFRRHFAFRSQLAFEKADNIRAGDVRDLHQLVLTGIAHTDRHIRQIRVIKNHEQFPPDRE